MVGDQGKSCYRGRRCWYEFGDWVRIARSFGADSRVIDLIAATETLAFILQVEGYTSHIGQQAPAVVK